MVVLLAGALGGLNSTPHEPLVSLAPSAAPFPEPAVPQEPCLLQRGCTARRRGPSGRLMLSKQTLVATFKSVEDPSISLQHTGRKKYIQGCEMFR